jgi:hypothetical protein
MFIQGQQVTYIEPGPKFREAEIEAITETHVFVHVPEYHENGHTLPMKSYTMPLTINQVNDYVRAKEENIPDVKEQ